MEWRDLNVTKWNLLLNHTYSYSDVDREVNIFSSIYTYVMN